MRTLSIEQQVALLRPTMKFAAHMHTWLMVGAALCAIAAVVLWNPIPLMFSFFLAIVGFSEQLAGPNIVKAISAIDCDTPSQGEVTIYTTLWDTGICYHAIVREPLYFEWEYEFIPQGWQPVARSYPAKIWRDNVTKLPVIAVVEGGILIPRYEPEPVKKRN